MIARSFLAIAACAGLAAGLGFGASQILNQSSTAGLEAMPEHLDQPAKPGLTAFRPVQSLPQLRPERKPPKTATPTPTPTRTPSPKVTQTPAPTAPVAPSTPVPTQTASPGGSEGGGGGGGGG